MAGPLHGVLRRIPVPHRRRRSAGCCASSSTWASSTAPWWSLVSDNGASAEGGAEGSINDVRLSNLDPAGLRRAARPDRRDRRSADPQQLPVGLDDGRQHAVQALEARGARGRRGRPVHRGLARRRGSRPAASATSSPTPSTCCPTVLELVGSSPRRPSSTCPSPTSTASVSATCCAPAAEPSPGRHATQHFEMFGSRAIYHDGWKAVTFHPVGPIYGDGLDPNAPFDDDVWELYHVADDLSETQDLAAEHPDVVGRLVDLWWARGASATRSCRSTTACCGPWCTPSPTTARERSGSATSPAAPRCPSRWPSTCATAPTRSGRRRRRRRRRPAGHPAGARLGPGRLVASTCWTAGPATCTTSTARSSTSSSATRVAGAGPPPCRVRVRPRTRAWAERRRSCVDGQVVAEGPIDALHPARLQRRRRRPHLWLRVGPGDRRRATWRPSPSPAPSTRAVVEATGPVVRDPLAELAAILSEQ